MVPKKGDYDRKTRRARIWRYSWKIEKENKFHLLKRSSSRRREEMVWSKRVSFIQYNAQRFCMVCVCTFFCVIVILFCRTSRDLHELMTQSKKNSLHLISCIIWFRAMSIGAKKICEYLPAIFSHSSRIYHLSFFLAHVCAVSFNLHSWYHHHSSHVRWMYVFQKDRIYNNNNIKCNERQIIIWEMEERRRGM